MWPGGGRGAAGGPDQTQVAHVIGGADGSEMAEFLVEKALPQIRRFENMHVAVQNFETAVRHSAPRIVCQLSDSSSRRRFEQVEVIHPDELKYTSRLFAGRCRRPAIALEPLPPGAETRPCKRPNRPSPG